jgi:hypothetical protein
MSSAFPIGSVVRPLNETGEGVVSAYRADGTILVTMQDGFEIPFLPRQIVLISKPESATSSIATTSVAAQNDAQRPEGLYFAFVSEGLRAGTHQVKMILVNHSSGDILLQVFGVEGKQYKSLCAQALAAQQQLTLVSGDLHNVLHYDRFYVQLFPVVRDTTLLPAPWSGYVKHQIPALADPASWPTEWMVSRRALLIPVYPERSKSEPVLVSKDNPASRTAPTRTPSAWLISERDGYHEVDLHIEELLDDTRGMDNAAIIRYQLQHFLKCVDEARQRRIWKFTAIHGIGKGVLKAEIRNAIQDEGLKHQDASYARYGFGATEVLLR